MLGAHCIEGEAVVLACHLAGVGPQGLGCNALMVVPAHNVDIHAHVHQNSRREESNGSGSYNQGPHSRRNRYAANSVDDNSKWLDQCDSGRI